jgi:hypothetical protein
MLGPEGRGAVQLAGHVGGLELIKDMDIIYKKVMVEVTVRPYGLGGAEFGISDWSDAGVGAGSSGSYPTRRTGSCTL